MSDAHETRTATGVPDEGAAEPTPQPAAEAGPEPPAAETAARKAGDPQPGAAEADAAPSGNVGEADEAPDAQEPAAAAEPTTAEAAPVAKPAKKAPKAPPPKKAPRDLPSHEEIAAWVEGADCPKLGELFAVPLAKWDALGMQIKKEELLPQHWQVLTAITSPDDAVFESLPEIGRLRVAYRDQELSRRRLAALREAWRALRGKQPSLWTVSDLFAAVRRLMERKVVVDWHDLLSAVRDLWAGMSVPHGREQLEVLWACLDFIRSKSK